MTSTPLPALSLRCVNGECQAPLYMVDSRYVSSDDDTVACPGTEPLPCPRHGRDTWCPECCDSDGAVVSGPHRPYGIPLVSLVKALPDACPRNFYLTVEDRDRYGRVELNPITRQIGNAFGPPLVAFHPGHRS